MSKKLEILKQSLIKKEEQLRKRFDDHFATVGGVHNRHFCQTCVSGSLFINKLILKTNDTNERIENISRL